MTPDDYVRRLRNDKKRAYAVAYLLYLRGVTDSPPEYNGLSCMGAQAVRINLNELHPARRNNR